MAAQPLVSVITAAYNAEKYISPCIESVINQTYQNWEMWIVDDASMDDTKTVAQAYTQNYANVHYIRLDQNTGSPAHPRNFALNYAAGRYLAFLDGDDMFMPTKLEEQVDFMQKKDCAISYTGMRRIDADGKKVGHYISANKKITYPQYLGNTCIPFSSSIVDREKVELIHFDEDVPRGRDDTALWIDLLKHKHEAYGLNKDLTRFRQGHGSISGNFLEMAKGNWQVYKKYAGDLNLPQRALSFCMYGFNAVKNVYHFNLNRWQFYIA